MSTEYVIEVFLNKDCTPEGTPLNEFAEAVAGWSPSPPSTREFSVPDIRNLLEQLQGGRAQVEVIGWNEFPYTQNGKLQGDRCLIEREYWLKLINVSQHVAGEDGLAILHVHYAGRFVHPRHKRDYSVITQMNIRHTVRPDVAVPGENAYWKKCLDLDKWREMRGSMLLELPQGGWRWREQPDLHCSVYNIRGCGEVH